MATTAQPATAQPAAPTRELDGTRTPAPSRMVTMDESLTAAINKAAGVEAVPAAAPASTPAAAPAGQEPAAPAKPAAAAPAAQLAAQPAAAPTKPAAAQPAATPATEHKTNKELREAYDRAKSRLEELEASGTATTKQLADAMGKLATAEENYAKVQKRIAEEFEPQVKRLSEVEKRLQEKEERLRISDYQQSEEFHERYTRPLAAAQDEVNDFMQELLVNDGNGNQRQATIKDFEAILAIGNHEAAAQAAKQMFGEYSFQGVMNHRMKLRSLMRSRDEAVKNAHLASAEWAERTQAQQAQARQQFRSALTSAIDRVAAGEDAFKVAEDDAEARAALDEGVRFGNELLDTPAGTTPEQLVESVAKAQVRVRAYPRLRQTISRQAAEITNLKKQLEGYQRSEPTVETRNGGTQAAMTTFASNKEEAGAKLMGAILEEANRKA